jgi:hypothetical protein
VKNMAIKRYYILRHRLSSETFLRHLLQIFVQSETPVYAQYYTIMQELLRMYSNYTYTFTKLDYHKALVNNFSIISIADGVIGYVFVTRSEVQKLLYNTRK